MEIFQLFKSDTNLIRYKDTVHKVRTLYDDKHLSPEITEALEQTRCAEEIEEAFRALMYMELNNEFLKTIRTNHFLITTTRKKWKAANKLKFLHQSTVLANHPFFLELYIKIRDDVPLQSELIDTSNDVICEKTSRSTHDKADACEKIVVNQKSVKSNVSVGSENKKYSLRSMPSTKSMSNTKKVLGDSDCKKQHSSTRREQHKGKKVMNCSVKKLATSPSLGNTSHTEKKRGDSDFKNHHLSRGKEQYKGKKQMNCSAKLTISPESQKSPRKRPNTRQRANISEQPVKDITEVYKKILSKTSTKCSNKHTDKNCENEMKKLSPGHCSNSNKRCTRQIINQVKDDESARLHKMQSQKPHERRHRTRAKIDRHLIEEEELDEELKLQHISGPSVLRRSPRKRTCGSPPRNSRKRKSSGFWDLADLLLDPLKKIWQA